MRLENSKTRRWRRRSWSVGAQDDWTRLLPESLRHRLIRSRRRIDLPPGTTLEVAETPEELLSAARLLHDVSVELQQIAPHPSGLRLFPQQLTTPTVTLLARRGAEVIGTVSGVADSAAGLPGDLLFPAELATLRANPRRLGEVFGLALHRDHRDDGVQVLLQRGIFQTLYSQLYVDDAVMAVPPAAIDDYRVNLLFGRIGPVREAPGAGPLALWVPLLLPLDRRLALYRERFGKLPRDRRNSYWVFFQRSEPALWLPRMRAAEFQRHLAAIREQALPALLEARPDLQRFL